MNEPRSDPPDNESLISDNPSKNNLVNEQPTIINFSASGPFENFRNLEQSHHVIHDTDNLLLDQLNSLDILDESSRKKSSFKPSNIFRNLLHTSDDNEAEEFACEWRIFQPNFPTDVLSEDKYILRDLRNVFEKEGKLKDSTGQTETWGVQQNAEKDVFENLSEGCQRESCYDWNKFLERWEGLNSDSTSEAHYEPEIIEKFKKSLSLSSTSKSKKRKKNARYYSPYVAFNARTKKRPGITKSSDTITSTFNSSSSDEEYDSNQKLHSFENEMEMIVHTVPSDITKANTSKLEKFLKETKIKLLKDDPVPPLLEKFISLDSESFPNLLNDSSLSSDSFKILQEDTKNIINIFKNRICAEENVSCSNK